MICYFKGCDLTQAKGSVFCEVFHHSATQELQEVAVAQANARQVGGDHYRKKIQTWDFIIAQGIGFLEGNAIKYIARHKDKGGKEDLEKAIHYLQKAIEVYYK